MPMFSPQDKQELEFIYNKLGSLLGRFEESPSPGFSADTMIKDWIYVHPIPLSLSELKTVIDRVIAEDPLRKKVMDRIHWKHDVPQFNEFASAWVLKQAKYGYSYNSFEAIMNKLHSWSLRETPKQGLNKREYLKAIKMFLDKSEDVQKARLIRENIEGMWKFANGLDMLCNEKELYGRYHRLTAKQYAQLTWTFHTAHYRKRLTQLINDVAGKKKAYHKCLFKEIQMYNNAR